MKTHTMLTIEPVISRESLGDFNLKPRARNIDNLFDPVHFHPNHVSSVLAYHPKTDKPLKHPFCLVNFVGGTRLILVADATNIADNVHRANIPWAGSEENRLILKTFHGSKGEAIDLAETEI